VTRPAPATAPEIDTSCPAAARVYDYLLGGKSHFAADRELAGTVLASVPAGRTAARENRAFLGRAVRYLASEQGVRQYLDIGAGLPAADSVHEAAQRAAPESRVVCVDRDPMVLAHARALLTSSPEGRTGYVQADLRDPEAILGDPVTRETIDFTQPVALILAAVLHHVQDEDSPEKIVAALVDALPAGSYLVASHLTGEHNRAGWTAAERGYRAAGMPAQLRDSDEFARLAFAGLEMVPPGVVLVSEWRPDSGAPRPAPAEVSVYGGVACKR
jgi:O-methyltransferase involved in polyketide biosynthesis